MNTTYFLNCVASSVFHTASAIPLPSNYYIGLSTTTPSMAGVGVTEPSSSAGYARVKLEGLSFPVDGEVKNGTIIEFPESTDDWGQVTYAVIYDSATGGNLLIFSELPKPRTVEADTVLSILPSDLNLSVLNA